MDKFIDLGVSVFDADFTLNPYDYLKDLYDRPDVLGFHADNMNFLFRFEQSRAVMFNKKFPRAMGNNEELQKLERDYAQRFPNRAWHFQHSYTHGAPNLKFKAAIGRFVADVAERASFAGAEPIFLKLANGGVIENYIDDVATLPMRVFLDACKLPYSDSELTELHQSGCAFLKSLENFYDEALLADCDAGLARLRQYMEEHYHQLDGASPLHSLIAGGRECGMTEEQLVANIVGMFLTSISNTVGISSAFILRTLLRDHGALQLLREQPELVQREQVIMELLRRDNHVKALSRQCDEPMSIDGFDIVQGEVVCLFFPGINMDHNHWPSSLALDFNRVFTGENNIVFGGSFYACIGRKLAMAFLSNIVDGFVRHLPPTATVRDDELVVDGSWMAERIISKMPIHLV
ncbi:MAG: cytochrome P450 [Halioglobus sp.]